VFVPESAPWLETYLDEMCSFNTGLHDDQVDSTTQALNWFRSQSSTGGAALVEYLKRKVAALEG
jgi:phage terminase large subunit-like protein